MLKKQYSDLKLSAKINVIIISILLMFAVVASSIVIFNLRKIYYENAQLRGQEIAEFFALISSSPLDRMDFYGLESNSKELLKNKDVVAANVYDNTDFCLTPSRAKKMIDDKYIHAFKAKINNSNDDFIGYVVVEFSYKTVEMKVKTTLTLAVLLSLLFISITYFSVHRLIRRTVIKPIASLVDSVNIIASGELDYEAKIFANDEIGQLADQFNLMKSKLRRSMVVIQNVLESMPSMLVALDRDGNVSQWNSSATRITGIELKQAFGENFWSLDHPFRKFRKEAMSVIKNKTPIQFHYELSQKDKAEHFNISIFPLIIKEVRGIVFRVDDVSEIESKEKQLRQAQKMESIGALAGGIAHDFNNILGGIIGGISIINLRLNQNKKQTVQDFKEYIGLIEESAFRASDLVKQLLTLSRKQELKFAPVDLNLTIRHVVKICKNTFDKSINISIKNIQGAALTYADPIQMEQVLLNLCINASHAMTIMKNEGEKLGGELSIQLTKIISDRFFIDSFPEAELKEYWMLTVTDSGIGMDSDTISKIFDPFFTTKDKDKGTGLGLAMVYNIIKQHKGFINVYSEKGVGSTFNIYLPILKTKRKIIEQNISTEELVHHQGTILIIDDEAIMRHMAAKMLEELGFKILLAENGDEGLKVYKQFKNEICLILLDVVMPKKSGEETFYELQEMDLKVPVILISGFSTDSRISRLMHAGVSSFVQKPFTIEKLSKIVTNALQHK